MKNINEFLKNLIGRTITDYEMGDYEFKLTLDNKKNMIFTIAEGRTVFNIGEIALALQIEGYETLHIQKS